MHVYNVIYYYPLLPLAGIGRGSDYTQTSMSITLTGQEEQVISVRLENDQIYEFAESFSASLSASGVLPSFVTLGPDMAQANIADDDSTLYIVIVLCVCVGVCIIMSISRNIVIMHAVLDIIVMLVK